MTNFFTVADEALHARAARDSSRRADYDREEDTRPTNPQLQPDRRTTMGAAQAPAAAPTPSRGVAAPAAARAPAGARADAPAAARTPVAAAPLAAAPTRMPTPPPPAAAPNAPMEARTTGGWAVGGVPPNVDGDVTAEGPRGGAIKAGDSQSFGGLIRPVATDEAMFTSGRNDSVFGNFDEDEVVVPRRRGAGLWIALGALVVTGGAAAAVYFMVLRPRARDDRRAAALIDAAVPSIATGSDGGLAPGPLDAASTAVADLVEDARTQLARDTATALIASGKALADGGGDSASALALRARLLTAQAQIINDEADLAADAATADKIRRDGKQLVLDALTLAQKALKAAPTDPDANLAMADVLRLQGKPAAEVRRYLSSAKGDASAQREATLIGALLDLRDQQAARAKDALTRLDSGDGALEATGDVRPRWRLAMIAGKAQAVVARAAAEAVLAAQPDHAGARALLAKVAAVGTDDPMPPEDGSGSGSGSAGSGPGSGSAAIGPGSGSATRPPPGDGGGGGPPISGGYDGLLAKANKLAEVSCGQAIPYYQKALEAKPNSVEALTGMGFCHLDAKQFSSAHSKFRAALGISPRYERALWGMAEMYQQQGRSDLAIEAYQAYLAVYPRSVAAQRQLDRLQGKTTGTPTPPEPGGGSDPVPTPTPAPPTPETGPDLPQDDPQTTP